MNRVLRHQHHKMHWKIAICSRHAQAAWGQTCCAANGIFLSDLQLASCASFDLQRLGTVNDSAIELAQHTDQACLSAADLSRVQALSLGFHSSLLEPCKCKSHNMDRHIHMSQGPHNRGLMAKTRREGLHQSMAGKVMCEQQAAVEASLLISLHTTVTLVQNIMLIV